MNQVAQVALVAGLVLTTLSILGMGWAVLRKLNYIYDALTEYPPHRHINGKILYPKEFAPGRVEAQAGD